MNKLTYILSYFYDIKNVKQFTWETVVKKIGERFLIPFFLSLNNILYKKYNIQLSLVLALFVTFYFLNSGSKGNVLN